MGNETTTTVKNLEYLNYIYSMTRKDKKNTYS